MRPYDLEYIGRAIAVAAAAREHGNHPFGAVLVNSQGELILEAENTVITGHDCTGHAETNLVRKACAAFPPEVLAGCTLYTSTEPCVMCSGAIFWAGVSRVVFALSEQELFKMVENNPNRDYFNLPCREVFARAGRPVEVEGPLVEDQARLVHLGFWNG
jgi:tRNA(Arg) A34 adenosine deaminase TadA